MKFRTIARFIFVGLGVVELVPFITGTSDSYSQLFSAGFLFFIAATNFCKECPLLFFLRRSYWKMRSKKIPMQKL